mmetsp:Transcript_66872/g.185185  ORF Transcript_66872/g.185185 Transcript_66872/m.185185 type:complete len:259 (-) Transcript_66872:748-1524(-)
MPASGEAAHEASARVPHGNCALAHLHQASAEAGQPCEVLEHMLRAEVWMPRRPLLKAVAQGDARHASDQQRWCTRQHKAEDRSAWAHQARAREGGRQAPGPLDQDRMVRRHPRAIGYLNELGPARMALRLHHAHHRRRGAAGARHAVALAEAVNADQRPIGKLRQRGPLDAQDGRIVVRGHAQQRSCPAPARCRQLSFEHVAPAGRGCRQVVEDVVRHVLQSVEELSAVYLHARILEVVALLRPVRTEEGVQVVDAPP